MCIMSGGRTAAIRGGGCDPVNEFIGTGRSADG
jgi:hypothetical protein